MNALIEFKTKIHNTTPLLTCEAKDVFNLFSKISDIKEWTDNIVRTCGLTNGLDYVVEFGRYYFTVSTVKIIATLENTELSRKVRDEITIRERNLAPVIGEGTHPVMAERFRVISLAKELGTLSTREAEELTKEAIRTSTSVPGSIDPDDMTTLQRLLAVKVECEDARVRTIFELLNTVIYQHFGSDMARSTLERFGIKPLHDTIHISYKNRALCSASKEHPDELHDGLMMAVGAKNNPKDKPLFGGKNVPVVSIPYGAI